MSKQTEALKLALKALEEGNKLCLAIGGETSAVFDPAITVIREALSHAPEVWEQPAIPLGAVRGLQWDKTPQAFNDWWDSDYDPTGNPFRQDSAAYWAWAGWKAATEQPAQQQEPVAWMHPDGRIWTFGRGLDKSTFTIPLYTSPPAQRKPLTDEQREEIAKKWRGRNWTVGDIIDAIEAAHGIKGDA